MGSQASAEHVGTARGAVQGRARRWRLALRLGYPGGVQVEEETFQLVVSPLKLLISMLSMLKMGVVVPRRELPDHFHTSRRGAICLLWRKVVARKNSSGV